MAVEQWDETGKVWDDDHGLLEPDQIAKCGPADAVEPFRAPVPTQIVSNGEYMPEMQTENQRSVQARIECRARHVCAHLRTCCGYKSVVALRWVVRGSVR